MFQQGSMLNLDSNENMEESLNSFPSIPEEQRQMAVQARYHFKIGEYSSCLQILKKLQALRPQDVKVFHNISVAEYYLTNCSDTTTFYENLLSVCKQAHIDDDFDLIDDVDFCVVFYNKAVVMYHLQKYDIAIQLLDKVFQFVEPLEEALALKICFLLIELYLTLDFPRKALGIANYIENTNFSKGSNYGKGFVKDASDNTKAKLAQYRARCYTKMKTFKPSKREVKSLMASKVQDQQIAGLFVKSELEYSRSNYKKALRIITSAQYPKNHSEHFLTTGDSLKVYSLNNLACIHYSTSKPALGIHYLMSALKLFQREQALLKIEGKVYPSNQPLHTLRGDLIYKLALNVGTMHFKSKNYKDAFHFYLKTTQFDNSNPKLWLRIAECCIHHYEMNKTDAASSSMVKCFVGSGPNKKAILVSNTEPLQINSVSKPCIADEPTLSFALFALKKAWSFLPDEPDTLDNSSLPSQDISETTSNLTLLSIITNDEELLKFRQFILLNLSFVCLCTGDVFSAHAYAIKLLTTYKVTGFFKYLASSYAAQALVSLDRISEAIEHFNLENFSDIFLDSPNETQLNNQSENLDAKSSDNCNIVEAKSIALYNLAVVYTIRGEWSRACNTLSKINPEMPLPVKNLQTYIDLCQGATDVAIDYLKHSFAPTI